ncbi:RNA-directed DNA polymerase, eukaryota [Tanacetum coccineum]|uniref:RNA-directed DNA polymerase, eukaryota n=1 Tax=Tanacetum coccineum TaxID=301880 RepID=A0ABQ4Y568_9ASTR
MVDVPINQEDPPIQITPLIDTVISMVTEKTTSTPTPLTTQAQVTNVSESVSSLKFEQRLSKLEMRVQTMPKRVRHRKIRKWTDEMVQMIDNLLLERWFKKSLRSVLKFCYEGKVNQNWRDLSRDIQLDRIEVLRYYTKGVKVRKGIMQTKTELTLEQTQQGDSDELKGLKNEKEMIRSRPSGLLDTLVIGDAWPCKVLPRKARSGIEEMQLNSLAEISRMTTLVPCEDRYVWTLESDGVFSVASIRKEIDGNRFQDVSLPTRWVKSVPIKVNIIAWKVKFNALPTRFNISHRGMDIDSIVCPICNAGVESTNHIFFQCVVVRQIMRKIYSWWNIDYSDVNSYEEWRVWLVSIRIQSNLKGVLESVYYGLWWYMWNFRNKLLFDKKIPEKALIFDNLVSSFFYWCKFRCKAAFKWDDWLKNPYIVLV